MAKTDAEGGANSRQRRRLVMEIAVGVVLLGALVGSTWSWLSTRRRAEDYARRAELEREFAEALASHPSTVRKPAPSEARSRATIAAPPAARELYAGPLASVYPLPIMSTDSDQDGCPELLVRGEDSQLLLVADRGDCDLDTPWRAHALEYGWATLVAVEPGVLAILSHDFHASRLILECGQPWAKAWEVSGRAEQTFNVEPVAVARGPDNTLVVADLLRELHVFTVANCELSAIGRYRANSGNVLASTWFQAPERQVVCLRTVADVPALLLQCASWPLEGDGELELTGIGWLFAPDIFLEHGSSEKRAGFAQVNLLSFSSTEAIFTALPRLPEPVPRLLADSEPFTPQLVTASRSADGSIHVLYTPDRRTLTALTLGPSQPDWREQVITDLGDADIVALHSTVVGDQPAVVIVLHAVGDVHVLMLRLESG